MNPPLVAARLRATVPIKFDIGEGRHVIGKVSSFELLSDGLEHISIDFRNECASVPIVRVHSECLTGDVFGSMRCDCGPQLQDSLKTMAETGGVLLYMRQEGRGIGLYNKIDAYRLQDAGLDTFAANESLGRRSDERDYLPSAQMLFSLGIRCVDLLSNNPDKVRQLEYFGVEVRKVIKTGVHLNAENYRYLMAKVQKSGHTIDLTRNVSF